MNPKTNIDVELFKLLYEKYKEYILPIAIIFASILLIVNVTIPQINELFGLAQQRKAENEKLSTLNNNLKIFTELNDGILDSQLTIATDALPANKDFASILNAVSISADKAGVFLGDYEFEVGDLSSGLATANFPSLELTLIVSGESRSILRFVDELYRSNPVSEVINLEMNNNRATVTTIFYYKPFSEKTLNYNLPIQSISQKNLETIDTISSWNNPKNLIELPENASPSASSPF